MEDDAADTTPEEAWLLPAPVLCPFLAYMHFIQICILLLAGLVIDLCCLLEMLKEGGEDVHLALHRLFLGIWRTEAAPKHFKQDILIPIAKKGDSSLCANYRTIALQSIAAKAYANVQPACANASTTSYWSSSMVSCQTEAAQTLCSAYAVFANRHGKKARHFTCACWT